MEMMQIYRSPGGEQLSGRAVFLIACLLHEASPAPIGTPDSLPRNPHPFG